MYLGIKNKAAYCIKDLILLKLLYLPTLEILVIEKTEMCAV
jgi:hypothetical protein